MDNQTTWIVGGGVIIIAIAIGLYTMTGSPSGKNLSIDTYNVESTQTPAAQTKSQATIRTSLGNIVVRFYDADAPKTVENFLKLSKEGFYNGTRFHRVIKGFMIQGGDPLSKDDSKKSVWGTGGPGHMFADEFNQHKLVRGSLAMANSGPNTNGSQFFIVTADQTAWLDGKHTNFGEVIEGMDIITKIENTKTGGNDQPVEAISIIGIDVQ